MMPKLPLRRMLFTCLAAMLFVWLAGQVLDVDALWQTLAIVAALLPSVARGQTSYWTLHAELDRHLPLQDDAANTDIAVYEDGVPIASATLSGGDNTSAKSAPGPGGWLPKSLQFNGIDDHISVTIPTIGTTQQFTVAWRMYADTAAANIGSQIDAWQLSGEVMAGRWHSNNANIAKLYRNSGGVTFINLGATAATTWHSFAGVWDGTHLRSFLNGAASDSAVVGEANNPTTTLAIGSNSSSNRFFAGRLCDFAIWYRALTEAELSQWDAGPEPTYTSGATLAISSAGVTGSAGTWDAHNNGAMTYEWELRRKTSGLVVYSGVGDTINLSTSPPPGDFELWYRVSNDSGYDIGDDLDGWYKLDEASHTVLSVTSPPARLTSGTTDQYLYFTASLAGNLVTGLSNFTVHRTRNGGSPVAMTTPTISEVDSTNLPGLYKLLVDEDTTIDAGDDTQAMVLNVSCPGMDPVRLPVELYRPKLTLGQTLTVSTGALAKGTGITGFNDLDAAGIRSAIGLSTANLGVHLGYHTTLLEGIPTNAEMALALSPLALEATAQSILTDTAEIGVAGAGLTAVTDQLDDIEAAVGAINADITPPLQLDIDRDFTFDMPNRTSGVIAARNTIYLATEDETPHFAFDVSKIDRNKPAQVTSVEVLDSNGDATADLVVADEEDTTNCGVKDYLVISKVTNCLAAGTYTVKVTYQVTGSRTYVVTGNIVVP